MCDNKISKHVKQQETSEFLNSYGIKTPFNKIPWVDPHFFKSIKQVNIRYKMNKIVNNFLISRR